MIALLQLLLSIISIEPRPAAEIVAAMFGQPEVANELQVICHRESRCKSIGIHERDRWAGKTMHRNAMRVGWLQSWCPWHQKPKDPDRFSVRGSFGLSAAYSLRFLAPCLPPEVLDIPLVSAYAAAKRAIAQCERYGACTRAEHRSYWAGNNRKKRRKSKRVHRRAKKQVLSKVTLDRVHKFGGQQGSQLVRAKSLAIAVRHAPSQIPL